MRLRAEIKSVGFGVGRFEGAVSYLPRDIYSKLRAIFPSARRRASHRIASPEVAVWLEDAQTSSSSSSIEMIFFFFKFSGNKFN